MRDKRPSHLKELWFESWHARLSPSDFKGRCAVFIKGHYYSFKIFLRLWLVITERVIHHNQLLLTKYWTSDVKNAARCKLLNQWRQNDVKSAARCRLLNRWPRKPGDKVVLFWWAEKQRAKWRNSFKNGEIFWVNNKVIIEFSFRRMWRILQISVGDLQNSMIWSAEFFISYSASFNNC